LRGLRRRLLSNTLNVMVTDFGPEECLELSARIDAAPCAGPFRRDGDAGAEVAVGTVIAHRSPQRSVRAELP
jgi:hypothetical protein